MFKNFKVIMHMSSPIAVMDNIVLDSIISAAACKEILGDDYYSGANETGTKELQDSILSKILDKQYDVYCTSYGLGDNKEFVGTWSKRFDTKNDDLIKHEGKGKNRLDIGAGYYKNYHMPIILKSYKEIVFYVRGDLDKIQELLKKYIYFIGKKGSQGYGQIKEYEFKEIKDNYSIIKDKKIMRNVPVRFEKELKQKAIIKNNIIMEKSIIPPYWRQDYRELCFMPDK